MVTKQYGPSFRVSRTDSEWITKIANRADDLGFSNGGITGVVMDVSVCHANGCKLDLRSLMEADDENFAHDVIGIQRHIDRRTGELMDCFVPRFAARA